MYADRLRKNIPQALKQADQWVLWRIETREGKDTKVPYTVRGNRASTTDHSTWGEFDSVMTAYQFNQDKYSGIGFVFTEYDPFLGIDFDDCFSTNDNSKNAFDEYASQIQSYTEKSQSGNGAHIIAMGELPENRGRNNQTLGVEMYSAGRFFALTGDIIGGFPADVRNGSQSSIDELYQEISPPKPQETKSPAQPVEKLDIANDELLQKIWDSKNGVKVRALYDGNTTGYESQSEADQALCNHLAFWTQKDASRMDELFRASGLYRPEKWDRNARSGETYGQGTIRMAIESCGDVYEGPQIDPAGQVVFDNTVTDDDTDDFLLAQGAHDLGNALCVQRLNQDMFTFCDSYGWMVKQSNHFEMENATYIVNRAITDSLLYRRTLAVQADVEPLVKSTQPTTARKNAVRDMLRDISIISVNDFDNDPNLINCRNGVVDLRNGQLVSSAQSGKFTYCLPVDYNTSADMNFWKMFLYEVFEDFDNSHDWLQQAVGYSMTGSTSEECMFYVYGPTRSGKGTFTNAILKMLGDSLGKGVKFSMFTQKRDGNSQNFDMAPLKSCRFISASESGKYDNFDEATVKTITGGDPISCCFKGKDSFTYFPQFKVWLSSNHPVKGDVDDDAFWGRIRTVSFPKSMIGHEDKSLKAAIVEPSVLESILLWGVQGAVNWRKSETGLVTPDSADLATRAQRDSLDDVKQWLDQCTVNKDGSFLTNEQIRRSYESWCIENGYTPKKARSLGRALSNKNYTIGRETVNSVTQRGFYGLKISE